MKKIIILIIPILFASVACVNEQDFRERNKYDSTVRAKRAEDSLARAKQQIIKDSIAVARKHEALYVQLKISLNSLSKDLTNRHYSNIDDLLKTINDINYVSQFVINNRDHELDSISALAKKLEKELVKTQKVVFPILRKNYIQIADRMLWEENIDVTGSGKVITFIGGNFASNKYIQSFHNEVGDALCQYRFSKVNYKWYKGAEEWTSFRLSTLNDGDI